MAFMLYNAPLKAYTLPLIKVPVMRSSNLVQSKDTEGPQDTKQLFEETELPKEKTT